VLQARPALQDRLVLLARTEPSAPLAPQAWRALLAPQAWPVLLVRQVPLVPQGQLERLARRAPPVTRGRQALLGWPDRPGRPCLRSPRTA
jgi:hypothetical protein